MVSGDRIPRRALVAATRFGADLPAREVARAIAAGLAQAGTPASDVCAIERGPRQRAAALGAQLTALDFDARMRRARALILAEPKLEPATLAASATFELATRARQAGVPSYAVTADSGLDAFDARVLDLQVVLVAGAAGELAAAGRRLARII
jgi:glycerate kinase